MWSKDQARATKLRAVLSKYDIQLNESECRKVISTVEQHSHWDPPTSAANNTQELAEQYLDELIEAITEVNYAKFTQRFEEKYLALFPESKFKKSIRNRFEDVGDYVRRESLGCLKVIDNPVDDRYPNKMRYLWRCFFEKNEVLIRVSIYRKDDKYYVIQAGTL